MSGAVIKSCTGWRTLVILMVVMFVTALFWARSRDPFRRIAFTLKTPEGGAVRGMAVLPKGRKPLPVAVYLHGTGGDLIDDGDVLRLFAEQNLAAVGLEYNQTDPAVFDAQFTALQDYLSTRDWCRSNAIAWVGLSHGAQSTLSYALKHPERQPGLLVRLSGGWVEELGRLNQEMTIAEGRQPELGSMTVESTHYSRSMPGKPSKTHVLIVQGEEDNIFPAIQCRPLAEALRQRGMTVDVRTFAGQLHSFGIDRPVMFRGLAEYCAQFFSSLPPVAVNHQPARGTVWVLPGLAVLCWLLCSYREWRTAFKMSGFKPDAMVRAFRATAWLLTIAALADTAIHLGLPRLKASPTTLTLARQWLVSPNQKSDFDWLAQEPSGCGARIGVLVKYLELAELQREFFYPRLEPANYRSCVLSPVVDAETPEDMGWRQALWEYFYPRVRRETDPLAASRTIVRALRSRLTIVPTRLDQSGVGTIWERGITDAAGFERIYVATLRSVGIAARLDGGSAELLADNAWTPAPRPIVADFYPVNNKPGN